MDPAEAIVACKMCDWSRFCIKPPKMTKEQIDAEL